MRPVQAVGISDPGGLQRRARNFVALQGCVVGNVCAERPAMSKILRRIGIVFCAAALSPFYVIGFAFEVAKNWFQFGRQAADKAGDELIGNQP